MKDQTTKDNKRRLEKGKWGCIKCGKNYYRRHNFIAHWANNHASLMVGKKCLYCKGVSIHKDSCKLRGTEF